jgi:four helix bundle protein
MSSRRFTDLRVWKAAHDVSLDIYKVTARFPVEERYGLATQMRRASVSVAANIAEGFGRWTPRDRARFYEISKSSAEELRHYLILSRDLKFLAPDATLDGRLDSVCAMLHRLRQTTLGEKSEEG